jgi:uncharacterized protein YbjT (DUF2867 family)
VSAQSVLFVGGTGTISAACVKRAVETGKSVTVLNRGKSDERSIPGEVELVRGDIRSPESVIEALGGREFDVVAEFLAFTPEHIETDFRLFEGRTGQYIFISSASAYQTPPSRLPITESTPLSNPFWQ